MDQVPAMLQTTRRSKLKDAFFRFSRGNLREKWLRINGHSMEPTLFPGQYVLLDLSYFRTQPIRRSAIVGFRHEEFGTKILIKRVVGLPGERVSLEQGQIRIINTSTNKSHPFHDFGSPSEVTFRIEENSYFLLGDYPFHSTDSRTLGSIARSDILGLVWLRIWPPTLFWSISDHEGTRNCWDA